MAEGAFTRLFGWDVSQPTTPVLTESFVLRLPVTNGKAKALAASDIRWLSSGPGANEHTFVVLSRDGKGNGDTDAEAKHKDLVLASTKGATNLVDTEYTTTGKPVAPGSKLASGITPIETVEWIDMLDEAELARFGLQNGGTFDETLISAKWEAVALVPALDESNPNGEPQLRLRPSPAPEADLPRFSRLLRLRRRRQRLHYAGRRRPAWPVRRRLGPDRPQPDPRLARHAPV